MVKRFNLLLWFNLRPFVQKCSKIEPTSGFKPYWSLLACIELIKSELLCCYPVVFQCRQHFFVHPKTHWRNISKSWGNWRQDLFHCRHFGRRLLCRRRSESKGAMRRGHAIASNVWTRWEDGTVEVDIWCQSSQKDRTPIDEQIAPVLSIHADQVLTFVGAILALGVAWLPSLVIQKRRTRTTSNGVEPVKNLVFTIPLFQVRMYRIYRCTMVYHGSHESTPFPDRPKKCHLSGSNWQDHLNSLQILGLYIFKF